MMATAKNVQKLWDYICGTWDREEIADAAENYDFDIATMSKTQIAKLSDEDAATFISDLVEFMMDGFKIDNDGDLFDILHDVAGLDEESIEEILE